MDFEWKYDLFELQKRNTPSAKADQAHFEEEFKQYVIFTLRQCKKEGGVKQNVAKYLAFDSSMYFRKYPKHCLVIRH